MTNEQVIAKFFKGETGKATSLSTDGTKVLSYNTVVARHFGKNMVCITVHKYSPTTTAQVNMLIRMAKAKGTNIVWVSHDFLNPNIPIPVINRVTELTNRQRRGVM